MKGPLSCIMIATLLLSSVFYLSAIACESSQNNAGSAVTPSSQPADERCETLVTVLVSLETQSGDPKAVLRSSMRAGVAVGKAVGRAALVVAHSMLRAARPAAVALVRSAYELA